MGRRRLRSAPVLYNVTDKSRPSAKARSRHALTNLISDSSEHGSGSSRRTPPARVFPGRSFFQRIGFFSRRFQRLIELFAPNDEGEERSENDREIADDYSIEIFNLRCPDVEFGLLNECICR